MINGDMPDIQDAKGNVQKDNRTKPRIIEGFQLLICHHSVNHELHHSHEHRCDTEPDHIRENERQHVDYIAEETVIEKDREQNRKNQIARQANSSGSIYGAEISAMQAKQDEIWESSKEILARLAAIQ